MGLVLDDAWLSRFFSSDLVVHAEHINMVHPCDHDLFQAANASDWMQLMELKREHTLDSPVLCPGENRLPVLQSPMDPYAIYGVLFSVI